MNPVVFLDIDGVLNTLALCSQPGGRERFSPAAVMALKEILKRTSAKIVISSSWREDVAHRIPVAFQKNGLGEIVGCIIAHTPTLSEAAPKSRRADEIDAWLTRSLVFAATSS